MATIVDSNVLKIENLELSFSISYSYTDENGTTRSAAHAFPFNILVKAFARRSLVTSWGIVADRANPNNDRGPVYWNNNTNTLVIVIWYNGSEGAGDQETIKELSNKWENQGKKANRS